MYGVALSKGQHPARGPAGRRGTVWTRQTAPGRLERIVVGVLLWVVAALAVLLIEVAIGFALSGLGDKVGELLMGLAFLPTYFAVRHVWLNLRARMLPSDIDLYFRRRQLSV